MNRARQWLAELSRRPLGSKRVAPRRLVMPERLENRNAPGAMLPMPALFAVLGDDGGDDSTDYQVARSYRSAESLRVSPELSFSIRSFVLELRAEETARRSRTHVARQTTEFLRDSNTLRAESVDAVFSQVIGPHLVPVLPDFAVEPPPIVQPVEPEPESEPESEPSSGSEAIAEPTPTGSENTNSHVPVTSTLPIVVPEAPIVVPPVAVIEVPVGGGENASEDEPTIEVPPATVEEPSTPVEEPDVVPPPLQQPVITDPESEHNQLSPKQADPEQTATTTTAQPQAEEEPVTLAPTVVAPPVSTLAIPGQLSAQDVEDLLDRATRATNRNDAIIAIVDRNGRILGVHVEQGVIDNIPDVATQVFAIDGAIAKARTAAFFSNDEAILTSRTVRFISQSTVTQREVEANPNSMIDTVRGPGFVAPIGVGGHFPPDVPFTPHVDLFAIEHTNRDSIVHVGTNGTRQTVTVDNDGSVTAVSGDDIFLGTRFGANFAPGKEIYAPESYGLVTDLLSTAQSRGIATLPGGVPLYKTDPVDGKQHLVGGIGVFFPGTDGYATFEQNFQPGIGQTTGERLNAPLVLEAEYTAAVVAANLATIGGLPPVADIAFPPLPGEGRIDLAGITLESFGPHPYKLSSFLAWGVNQFAPGTASGTLVPVTKGGALALDGEPVPTGWLVEPTAGTSLTAQQVEEIIMRGIEEAQRVRAAIRLPLGERTSMVLAVTDLDGKVLGLFRMDDATVFSIDVAVAKARNVTYYADATVLQPEDQVPGVDPGVAFTNRTFRYLAEPRFPSGIDGTTPPPFSTLLTVGVNPMTAENMTGVTPLASSFITVLGYDAFNPGTNFREAPSPDGYQNGIVFFPGSTPLYNNVTLVGGFGVSGDGVDQDDVVTFSGAGGFLPGRDSPITRADEVFIRDVRLPYQKFPRNPRA